MYTKLYTKIYLYNKNFVLYYLIFKIQQPYKLGDYLLSVCVKK